MKTLCLPVAYASPIAYWVPLAKGVDIVWEIHDHYEKQTYRNRTYIHGANGKQLLSIPIKHLGHEGHQRYADVEIANEFPWQKQHWKTLQTAYRSSPFFEYYEDDIAQLYAEPYNNLMSFNTKVNRNIAQLLGLEYPESNTQSYIKKLQPETDLRHWANAKTPNPTTTPNYTQVFSAKNGFLPNLSILDLLFNEGPQSTTLLRSV
ncbi:MAG: WbqC family protein [Flavobacteriaceae bacterium]